MRFPCRSRRRERCGSEPCMASETSKWRSSVMWRAPLSNILWCRAQSAIPLDTSSGPRACFHLMCAASRPMGVPLIPSWRSKPQIAHRYWYAWSTCARNSGSRRSEAVPSRSSPLQWLCRRGERTGNGRKEADGQFLVEVGGHHEGPDKCRRETHPAPLSRGARSWAGSRPPSASPVHRLLARPTRRQIVDARKGTPDDGSFEVAQIPSEAS